MSFRITGLPLEQFRPLFGLPAQTLASRGVERIVVDTSPGYPDRITLEDAVPGESVLLLNFEHQPAATPFRAAHAIYVSEAAARTWDAVDAIPPALARRTVSLRAFDATHRMIAAELEQGAALGELVERMFRDDRVAYLHAHFAKWGCFAARVDRA